MGRFPWRTSHRSADSAGNERHISDDYSVTQVNAFGRVSRCGNQVNRIIFIAGHLLQFFF